MQFKTFINEEAKMLSREIECDREAYLRDPIDRNKYDPDRLAKQKYKDLNLNPKVSTCCICNSVPIIEHRNLPKKVIWYTERDLRYPPSDSYRNESVQSYYHIFCSNCKTELNSKTLNSTPLLLMK